MSRTTLKMALMVLILGSTAAIAQAQYGALQAPGLSPRYYFGTSKEILQRQSSGICAANEHSCLDINGTGLLSTGICCSNDKYCMIDDSFAPVCCEIGSNCGFPCASSQYQCKGTATVSGSTSITASCCERSCPSTSSFLCPSSLSGGCCEYGFVCQSGGSCATTLTQSTTESSGACPTAQTTCGDTVGGGCCSSGSVCAVVSSTNYCTSGTQSAVRTGSNGILFTSAPSPSNKSGLSTAAKAGIGGGIGGLALIVIGGVLYFCVRLRRKAARQSDQGSSVPTTSQVSESKSRPLPGRRQTADYFGPTATAGPFTESFSPGSPVSPIQQNGVPLHPQSPRDIAVPVEIDSNSPSPYLKKTPTATEYPIEMP